MKRRAKDLNMFQQTCIKSKENLEWHQGVLILMVLHRRISKLLCEIKSSGSMLAVRLPGRWIVASWHVFVPDFIVCFFVLADQVQHSATTSCTEVLFRGKFRIVCFCCAISVFQHGDSFWPLANGL